MRGLFKYNNLSSCRENEITLNSLGDGQYTDCKLKVTDSAGNTGVLLLGSFKVDTVAPSLNVTTSILQ